MLISFVKDVRGNFGVNAAIIAVPLIACAGLAVDFSLALVEKATLQGAADSAVLAAASSGSTSDSEIKRIAKTHFEAALVQTLAKTVSINSVESRADGTIAIEVGAEMPLTLGKVLFAKGLPVTVKAVAQHGLFSAVDVALVLDNTGSMAGRKMQDLKRASLSLVSTLEKTSGNKVRLGLVPFSKYVNVGMERRKEYWLSVENDYSKRARVCEKVRPVLSKSGCKNVSKKGVKDGVPYRYYVERCTSYTYGDEVTQCANKVNNFRWYGCVGSRTSPLDQTDEFKGQKYEGLLNEKCGTPIVPLASELSTVRKAIANMTAQNDTYIPAGILWGWTILSAREPFVEAAASSATPDRYMIIMTDGANTLRAAAPKHIADDDGTEALELTATLCENAKRDGIKIFTVGVGDLGKETQSALAACASDSKYAVFASDTASLNQVFDSFATAMKSPRLVE